MTRVPAHLLKNIVKEFPVCPYCNQASVMVKGAKIYPWREDLAYKTFYLCEPCQAWVGCHPNTDIPLGRLADKELRGYKGQAHAMFDPLWKSGKWGTRRESYSRLAKEMGIPVDECHMGMFDIKQCKRVIAVCLEYRSTTK